MFPALRKHLSYANVVATLALVFAMSGGALAAKHYLVNSTKQINPKVLRQLRGKAGATGSIGPTGLEGARGPRGEKGATGPPGLTAVSGALGATEEVIVRYAEVTVPNGSEQVGQANCTLGEKATGGGFELRTGTMTNVALLDGGGIPVPSEAGATPRAWLDRWDNESGKADTFRVYVVCASPVPVAVAEVAR